ncbi:MAG: exodeoxyribonuclease V subunit beta [Polyangiales bacterium]
MKTLDPESLALDDVAVVEASAGTGKTYTITSLFLRLLLERGLKVDQILVVTYTRAATAELRDRIRQRLAHALAVARGEPSDDALLVRVCKSAREREGQAALYEQLEAALSGLDEAPVLTIHGFCQRVLRDHAFESGAAFDAQLTPQAGPLLDEIADDYFMRELYATTPLRARLLLDEPAILRRLAARVSGGGLRILPDAIEEAAFDVAAHGAALETCRGLWRDARAVVVALVAAVKGIGKNAAKWADKVDELMRVGEPGSFAATKSFASFTRAGVRDKGGAAEHPFLDAAEALLALDRGFEGARRSVALAFRRRFVDYVDAQLSQRTRERGVRTFDALLRDLDDALCGPHGPRLTERLRSRYRAALVDEFQDTDPVQYRIFSRIFAGVAPLLLIGDPKQAIYGFRGADVAAYLAARGAAGERVYTLGVNWRSDPPLLGALNTLYGAVTRPFAIDAITYQPVMPPPSARARFSAPDGRGPLDIAISGGDAGATDALRRDVARELASDVAALLASGATREEGGRTRKLRASDVAVLCRTNNEAAQVQRALAEREVPSVLSGDASVFDSDDVPQLERALTAIAHAGDARALRAFLGSIYGGLSARDILDLEEQDAAWEQHRATFQRLSETWLTRGFMQALRGLVIAYDVETRLLARPDGTRRITNLWHLAELLAEAAMSERLGPLGLLRWLALVRRDEARRAELAGDAHELRLESGDDAVTLTTVHKSKGLEYPVVYCPFLWDAAKLMQSEKKLVRFHDPRAGDALTLDLGTADQAEHEALAEGEVLEEALRLVYVALTRAKHRITLVVPRTERLALSALGYVLFGGGPRDAIAARLSELIKNGGLDDALHARAAELGCFSVRTLTVAPTPPYQSALSAPHDLAARPVRRKLDQSYRVASFSALLARASTSAAGEAGLDRDALSEQAEREAQKRALEVSTLALGDFPRGAVAGQLVHEVLEHVDFDGADDALAEVANRCVRARGYEAALVPSLVTGLGQMLRTPLDARGLSLSMLSRRERLNEMEFVFPVDGTLSPRLLERVFRAHGAPPALPTYASELRELGFDALHGFMRGYVDLVFRHDDRYYVVDYKSNWLGPDAADYAPAKLPRPMADHHYYLQYHLYTLALHRHLAHRLVGYDYDQHMGGVYYLFLRGMAPAHPLGCGVFHDRPARALIEALDAALEGATSDDEPEDAS